MNNPLPKATGCLLFLLSPLIGLAQSWEVYNSKLQLQSRVIYDQIELLSETVKIGQMNGGLYLLSADLKPAVKIEAEEIYQYLSPWILVKGAEGLGAYHEYGQKNLDNVYDEIQTYFNFLLARKGEEYFVFERGTGKLTSLGILDEAKITHTGMVLTKKEGNYYLPLSKFPTKPYQNLEANESDFLLATEASGKGLINREGDYILKPVLDRLEHHRGNYYYAYDENQYLLIKANEKSGDIRYNSFHEITKEGDLMLEYIHGKLRRIMAEDGILLDTVGMEKVERVADETYRVFLRDDKLGLLGRDGWYVTPTAGVDQLFPGREQLFPAQKDGKMGVVNSRGNWMIQPQFEQVNLLSEGLAAYLDGGKYGLIDLSGNLISSPQWMTIGDFNGGVAIAEKDGMKVLIDARGNKLGSKSYEEILRLENDFFIVEDAGKSGLIDASGSELLKAEFDGIQRISPETILLSKNDQVGMSDLKGQLLFPIAYDEIILDVENDQILLKNTYVPLVITEPDNSKKRKRKGA